MLAPQGLDIWLVSGSVPTITDSGAMRSADTHALKQMIGIQVFWRGQRANAYRA